MHLQIRYKFIDKTASQKSQDVHGWLKIIEHPLNIVMPFWDSTLYLRSLSGYRFTNCHALKLLTQSINYKERLLKDSRLMEQKSDALTVSVSLQLTARDSLVSLSICFFHCFN